MHLSKKPGYWSREPGYWRDQARQVGKALALALATCIVLVACTWFLSHWGFKLLGVAGVFALQVWDWLASFTRLEWIAIIGILLMLRSLRHISRQIDALFEITGTHARG